MSEMTIAETSAFYHQFLQPVSDAFPCGDSLEYDSAFIMLLSKIQPKQGAEYGNFVEQTEPVNWAEVQRECAALMLKSKDVRLFIIMMRCRLRQVGLTAIEEGITALKKLMEYFCEQYYPLLFDEGEFEPLMRANAFADLDDGFGLISDLRNHLLPKAAGQAISLKEFEKSFATPRHSDALPEAMISAMLAEWYQKADGGILSLGRAATALQEMQRALNETLGDDAPHLPAFTHILTLFLHSTSAFEECIEDPDNDDSQCEKSQDELALNSVKEGMEISEPVRRTASAQKIKNREDALVKLAEVRAWFTRMEPGSPVIIVIELAEKLVGKSFTELLKILPSELISKIDSENT